MVLVDKLAGCCSCLVYYLFLGQFQLVWLTDQGSLFLHEGTCILQMQACVPANKTYDM